MKKLIAATIVVSMTAMHASNVMAGSKEEDIGFVTGTLAGAAIGGPVGAIVGAFSGVLVGGQVEKANQLEQAQNELAALQVSTQQLSAELKSATESIKEQQELSLQSTLAWFTNGLAVDLLFTTGSAELSEHDLSVVYKLASVLAQYPELSLTLDGYADPRGREADNLTLSRARANAVKNAFIDAGIEAHRINVSGHGEIAVDADVALEDDSYARMRRVSVGFSVSEAISERVAQQ